MRAALGFAIACGFAGQALAEPPSTPVHVSYRTTLGGMAVASSALAIEVIGDHYRLALDGLMIGGERTKTRARVDVTGTILRTVLIPERFSATLEHGDGRKTRVALGFAGGTLAMVAVLPPPTGGSGRTRPPLSQSRGLLDPLTALVIPAARANLAPLSVCGRTQRVFDGMRRYDIHMFPSRVEDIVVAGRSLPTLACGAELRTAATASRRPERWPPLTPRGQRALVWLAPVAGGRLLAPVRIESGLRFGPLSVEAADANAFTTASRSASLR